MHRALLLVAAVIAMSLLHPLCAAVERLLARGASGGTVDSLLILPVGVLGIVFLRAVIGLETFGVFAPLILAFAFERIGPPLGLALFVALLLFATPARLLLERAPFLSVARTGSLVVGCAILLLLVAAHGAALLPGVELAEIGLPVVALVGMVDRFVTAQMDQSASEAIRLSGFTLITAASIALLIGSTPVRAGLRAEPDLLFVVPPLCLLLGRFSGLRLLELWRFRRVAG